MHIISSNSLNWKSQTQFMYDRAVRDNTATLKIVEDVWSRCYIDDTGIMLLQMFIYLLEEAISWDWTTSPFPLLTDVSWDSAFWQESSHIYGLLQPEGIYETFTVIWIKMITKQVIIK